MKVESENVPTRAAWKSEARQYWQCRLASPQSDDMTGPLFMIDAAVVVPGFSDGLGLAFARTDTHLRRPPGVRSPY